jgi:sec-independent protein translocase protein TatA
MEIGVPELIIILVIVLLVFGVGRVSQVGGELGKAIRQFREGIKSDTPPSDAPVSDAPKQKG